MNITLAKAACLAAVVGLSATSLLVAKPAEARPSRVFLGSFTGSLAGELINGAIRSGRVDRTTVVYQPGLEIHVSPRPGAYPYYSPIQQVLYENSLVPTYCSPYTVALNFAPGQVVCAQPTPYVPYGVYHVHPQTLQLVHVGY